MGLGERNAESDKITIGNRQTKASGNQLSDLVWPSRSVFFGSFQAI